MRQVARRALHRNASVRRISAMGLKVAIAAAFLFGASSQIAVAQTAERTVPKAECGPADRTEAVQGRVTLAERFAPGAAKAYNCNLELVSQHKGEGTGWGMVSHDRCAYYDVRLRRGLPLPARRGTVVVDVSDSRNLKATSIDDLLNVNESMALAPARKLLVAQYWAIKDHVPLESFPPLEVWDVSDCSRPVRISSKVLPGFRHHYGGFPADGLTFYTASCCLAVDGGVGEVGSENVPVSAVFAVDLSDPKEPRELARWIPPDPTWRTHSVFVNEAGTRIYIAFMGDTVEAVNGFAILDSTDIKLRRPNAQFRVIQTMFWNDSAYSQMAFPFRSKGQDYLLFTDNAGRRSGFGFDSQCLPGLSGWGHARFINVSKDRPQLASKLMLEVNDPAKCASTLQDPVAMGYGSSWCGFDRLTDPRLLACGWLEGGLRVFDVRDLVHPREVAYYKPPATRTEVRPGAFLRVDDSMGIHTADAVAAPPRFGPDGKEIWFTSFDNGFQVVRFSDRFIAANRQLFE